MAISTTVEGLVKNKLPYLTAADNDSIEIFRLETSVSLQEYLKKPDDKLEDEAFYNLKERSLISDLVCCQLLQTKILAGIAGIAGADPAFGKYLKKAVAGSTEAEFAMVKKDEAALVLGAQQILSRFQASAQNKAIGLKFCIEFDQDGAIICSCASTPTPFIIYTPK